QRHKDARHYHAIALAEGFAPAVVYNNKAYGELQLGGLDEAGAALDQAIAIAPGMQAAWHNGALWVRAVTMKPIRRVSDGPIPDRLPEEAGAARVKELQAAKRALEDARPAFAEGLQAAERALELGPASGELHADLARLMALARREPDWAEQALTHLET